MVVLAVPNRGVVIGGVIHEIRPAEFEERYCVTSLFVSIPTPSEHAATAVFVVPSAFDALVRADLAGEGDQRPPGVVAQTAMRRVEREVGGHLTVG